MFPKVPQSSLGILRVPQLPPPLGTLQLLSHPKLITYQVIIRDPTASTKKKQLSWGLAFSHVLQQQPRAFWFSSTPLPTRLGQGLFRGGVPRRIWTWKIGLLNWREVWIPLKHQNFWSKFCRLCFFSIDLLPLWSLTWNLKISPRIFGDSFWKPSFSDSMLNFRCQLGC